jgi:hypothetical protein
MSLDMEGKDTMSLVLRFVASVPGFCAVLQCTHTVGIVV